MLAVRLGGVRDSSRHPRSPPAGRESPGRRVTGVVLAEESGAGSSGRAALSIVPAFRALRVTAPAEPREGGGRGVGRCVGSRCGSGGWSLQQPSSPGGLPVRSAFVICAKKKKKRQRGKVCPSGLQPRSCGGNSEAGGSLAPAGVAGVWAELAPRRGEGGSRVVLRCRDSPGEGCLCWWRALGAVNALPCRGNGECRGGLPEEPADWEVQAVPGKYAALGGFWCVPPELRHCRELTAKALFSAANLASLPLPKYSQVRAGAFGASAVAACSHRPPSCCP